MDKRLLAQTKPSGLLFTLPIILFSAFTVLIVRMQIFYRPMSQFYWTPQTDDAQLTDFFSLSKAKMIIVIACVALFFAIFKTVYGLMPPKKTILYIPMAVYCVFVLLSYLFSDYKDFALLGYNERFEGTIPLLCYMVMLYYVINSINTEKDVKQVLWPLAIASAGLSLLGLTQAVGHDFFRTELGQKLITPNYTLSDGTTIWQSISDVMAEGGLYFNFSFQNGEIYQTVYNPNYVSFYLTLLVPLWGMLFIHYWNKDAECRLWKKIALGLLFALNMYNFIGSKSSGGVIGIGVIGILGIVILNKQLLKMWKPLAVLFAITGVVLCITTDAWVPEISGVLKNSFGIGKSEEQVTEQLEESTDPLPASEKPWLDYLRTTDNSIDLSMNGDAISFIMGENSMVTIVDGEGNTISAYQLDDGSYGIDDDRFNKYMTLALASDEEGNPYVILHIHETDFNFIYDGTQMLYVNGYGEQLALTEDIEAGLFKNNLEFGTLRGYIWSRSFPLLKKTLLVGYGADTFCIDFPQNDYAGRFNATEDWMTIIVDKPHNMYLNVGIGTGCVSLVALLALYIIYIIQSIKTYWNKKFENDYILFVGFGIFAGVTGFMATGLVDDSSVSVMPMFYVLLGAGIAINMIINRREMK